MSDAYRALRARGHRLTLQEQALLVPAAEWVEVRAVVTRMWQTMMESAEP